uniref:Wsv161-like protein n=1 Tax=Penaeus semisulcatus majanivirus TaxID=2984274 RepID=A0A9C7BMA5_9VIRU|nr:MAG: wsv161-like protein [Penaeus semisulcatus majanivirus]
MSNAKVPWPIMRARIQDKRDRINKEGDMESMGMSVEEKGPTAIDKRKKRKTLNASSSQQRKAKIKNVPSPQQRKIKTVKVSSPRQRKNKTINKTSSQQQKCTEEINEQDSSLTPLPPPPTISLPTVSKEDNHNSPSTKNNDDASDNRNINSNKRKINNKSVKVKRKCSTRILYGHSPLPPDTKKLPRTINVDIGRRLRRILLEEINLPLRVRSQDKGRDRIEAWIVKNRVYNSMLRKFLNFDNSACMRETEDAKTSLNKILKDHQIQYIKDTLEERMNYEILCNLLFDLFKTPQLLNKRFQSNLTLIDTQKTEVKELSFGDYKNKLLTPIWKKMSQSIDRIIGTADEDFAKCLQSILDKAMTFDRAVTDLKKTMASIPHIRKSEIDPSNNNSNKQTNDNYQSVMIKQQEIIQMQEQLIKRQNSIIQSSSADPNIQDVHTE